MFYKRKPIRIRVAALIIEDDCILMVTHKKKNSLYWLLPGGGVEYGESLDSALKRELKEELDISIEVFEPVIICDSIDPSGKRHILNICFKCKRLSGDLKLGNDKRLFDYNFLTIEEIKKVRLYPPLGDEISKIMEGKSTKLYAGRIWQ
jgi:ADP-ribose pyrophosphatase YjhB (NUDIX family)